MKRLIPIILILLLVACAAPMAVTESPTESKTEIAFGDISGDELLTLVGSEVIILDVRTPEEYASGHVEGAINIPVTAIQMDLENQNLDPNQAYALYCRSGNRSLVAYTVLQKEGFEKLYHAPGVSQFDYPLVTE